MSVFYHRLQNMTHAPGLNGQIVALCNPQIDNHFLVYLPGMTGDEAREAFQAQAKADAQKCGKLWECSTARKAYEAEFGEIDPFKPSYRQGFAIWSRRQRLEDWQS